MKVEFLPGIAHISGSTKTRSGKRMVFRHFKSDKPGHGHLTICSSDAYKRTKPTTDAERNAIRLFSLRACYVTQLIRRTPGLTRAQAWAMAKADIPSAQPPESIFLHGKPLFKAMNDHVPLVQVFIPNQPEGECPVCRRDDAELYGLHIISEV